MVINELHQTVQGVLQQGKIDEALLVLIQGLEDRRYRSLQKDAVQLKSNYAQARYQYEVRGALPRPDFELIQNRTIQGIQAIVDKLDTFDARPVSPGKWRIAAISLVLTLLALGLWWKFSRNDHPGPSSSAAEVPSKTAPVTAQPPAAVQAAPIDTQPATSSRPKPHREKTSPGAVTERPGATAPSKPPEPETCSFQLILNGNMIDARILMDNQPADIVAGEGTQIKTIKTTPGDHKITLRSQKITCSFDVLISAGRRIMQPDICN